MTPYYLTPSLTVARTHRGGPAARGPARRSTLRAALLGAALASAATARGEPPTAPAATTPAPQPSPQPPPARDRTSTLTFVAGPGWWPGVSGYGPPLPGSPTMWPWGGGLALAVEFRVARAGGAEIMVGTEMSFFITNGAPIREVHVYPAGDTILETLRANVGQLLATARIRLADGVVRPFAGLAIGLGYVIVHRDVPPIGNVDTYFNRFGPGGWLAAGTDVVFQLRGLDLGFRVQLQAAMTFVGTATGFVPADGPLDGPVLSIVLGPLVAW